MISLINQWFLVRSQWGRYNLPRDIMKPMWGLNLLKYIKMKVTQHPKNRRATTIEVKSHQKWLVDSGSGGWYDSEPVGTVGRSWLISCLLWKMRPRKIDPHKIGLRIVQIYHGFSKQYPLVICYEYIAMENPPLIIHKSTINGPCAVIHSKLLVITRG